MGGRQTGTKSYQTWLRPTPSLALMDLLAGIGVTAQSEAVTSSKNKHLRMSQAIIVIKWKINSSHFFKHLPCVQPGLNSHVSCVHAQSCLTVCDPMDCSPRGCSVFGILQARILEWVAIPFSRGSS